jgi:plasmid stabilization system protein ParE
MVRRIQSTVERLEAFPESGRLVPERAASGPREVIVPPLRVVYRFRPERDLVQVLAVVHGSRIMPSFNDEEIS